MTKLLDPSATIQRPLSLARHLLRRPLVSQTCFPRSATFGHCIAFVCSAHFSVPAETYAVRARAFRAGTHAAHQILQVRSERRGSNRGSTFNVSGSKISLTVGLFQQIEYLVLLAKLGVAKPSAFARTRYGGRPMPRSNSWKRGSERRLSIWGSTFRKTW